MRIRRLLITTMVTAVISFANVANVSAESYTPQENRAWAALTIDPNAKKTAKIIGKSSAVKSMRWVCYELDSGTSWDRVGKQWQAAAAQGSTVREVKTFIAYGAAVSVSAVISMCPWHRGSSGLR